MVVADKRESCPYSVTSHNHLANNNQKPKSDSYNEEQQREVLSWCS